MIQDIPDLTREWAVRAERIAGVRARTDVTGMTRPARNPDERDFLARTGQLGPFVEVVVCMRAFGAPE